MRLIFDVSGHDSKKCLVNQREFHRDTLGFNEALRSALRGDPDIILVGEMRDLETIRRSRGIPSLVPCIRLQRRKQWAELLMCFQRQKKTWFGECCQSLCKLLSRKHF